jgi:hypothetical protein
VSPSFLCRTCATVMCDDCRGVAEEYQQLYQQQRAYLVRADDVVLRLRAENERLQRQAADYRRLLEVGQHHLFVAWMRSLSPSTLRLIAEQQAREAQKEATRDV